MINQGNDVPKNTIAIFKTVVETNNHNINNLLVKPSSKRDWFTPHFYRCLPLTIGNQYGFVIRTEFAFEVEWNGGPFETDVEVFIPDIEHAKNSHPIITSHFGSGIISVNSPFILRTPPGINLMTINPPNVVIPNITVMTGVVEADNLRRNFSFNLKIQIPNIRVIFPAGSWLAGFIPIPRNFADNFELKPAEELFSNDLLDEELQASLDANTKRREVEPSLKHGIGRDYYQGRDVYGNLFPSHQKP